MKYLSSLPGFIYGADGNRAKKTIGSTNFYYPIPTYEISGTTQKTSGDGTFRHRSLHF